MKSQISDLRFINPGVSKLKCKRRKERVEALAEWRRTRERLANQIDSRALTI